MDFFRQQDIARKKTKWLLLYFVLAVAAICVSLNMVVMLLLSYSGMAQYNMVDWFRSSGSAWVTGLTVLTIALGSGIRLLQLSGGGKAVADMVGARRVLPETTDTMEKRLINVVEEMSLASGTSMPRLYVMDNEQGINAFVAGTKASETVLVVTRGTLEKLNRSELQGVIGHEYSHILNGDMRMNVRLLGVLAGILLIGQFGEFILRNIRHGGGSSSRRSKDSGNIVLFLLAMSIALIVIGYVGLFFGRLIKSAISRQREFLADASSVQFTRDNQGIAGALAKIQVHSQHALLQTPHAEDMSHMCFGQPITLAFGGLMATHPPVPDRIKALGFTPDSYLRETVNRVKREETQKAEAEKNTTENANETASETLQKVLSPAMVMASIGQVKPEHMAYAEQLKQQLPASLQKAAHDRLQAPSLLLALLLVESQAIEKLAALHIERKLGSDTKTRVLIFLADTRKLTAAQRLPLLNMMRTALDFLDKDQREALVSTVHEVARLDQSVTAFEYVLSSLAQRWLQPPAFKSAASVKRFSDVKEELVVVLAMVCRASGSPIDVMQAQYNRALNSFQLPAQELRTVFDAQVLHQALEKLDLLLPMLKKNVLQTLSDLVLADRQVTAEETELLRAIAEHWSCPMPPLLLDDKSPVDMQ